MGLDPTHYDLRSTLVPFVTRVLHYGPTRTYAPGQWPLPVGDASIYYDDDVEGFKAVLPQGILYAFIYHAGGWRRRDVLVGPEAWSAEARCVRWWELTESLELRFSEAAIHLTEGLYNTVARWPKNHSKHKRYREHTPKVETRRLEALELDGVGDVALVYWLMSGIWGELDPSSPTRRLHRESDVFVPVLDHFGARHPMLDLRFGPFGRWPEVGDDEALEVFIEGPWRYALPWWMDHALGFWQEREQLVWEWGFERFVEVHQRKKRILERWIGVIRKTGWLHLLVPIADHFARTYEELLSYGAAEARQPQKPGEDPPDAKSPRWLASSAISRVDLEFRELRQMDRFAVREALAGSLDVVKQLEAVYNEVTGIHPVDRDAHQVWFAGFWADNSLSSLISSMAEVARGIEGRLG